MTRWNQTINLAIDRASVEILSNGASVGYLWKFKKLDIGKCSFTCMNNYQISKCRSELFQW